MSKPFPRLGFGVVANLGMMAESTTPLTLVRKAGVVLWATISFIEAPFTMEGILM